MLEIANIVFYNALGALLQNVTKHEMNKKHAMKRHLFDKHIKSI